MTGALVILGCAVGCLLVAYWRKRSWPKEVKKLEDMGVHGPRFSFFTSALRWEPYFWVFTSCVLAGIALTQFGT